MMNKTYLIFFTCLSCILCSQTNIIQNIIKTTQAINSEERKKLGKAKAHDRAGLTKEANLIYSQLFNDNPFSKEVFSSYKIFLKKHKYWDEMINISEIYAQNTDDAHNPKLSLADSYLVVGRDSEAYALFDELFKKYDSDIKILKHLISKLIYNNKIEYAEQRIQTIRSAYNAPDFYSIDLGMTYFSKMIYEKSLDEYILYLTHNTNHMDIIRSKLMAFPINDDLRNMIIQKLKLNSSKIAKIILAEYHFTWKNYHEAYELMIENYIEEKSLYDFSIDMIMAEQFENAEKILTYLLKSKDKNIVELSIYQLATILESQVEKNISKLPISDKFMENSFSTINHENNEIDLKSNSISNAIMMYDSLVINFDNEDAKFKLAKLNYLINKNYEKSIIEFEDLEKRAKDKQIQFLSSIEIIELQVLNNKIDDELINKIKKYQRKYKKDEQQALLDLKLNLIYFYKKDFDEVSENLKKKIKETSKESLYYNDFLDGLMIIMLFNNNQEELSKLSDTFINMEQGDINRALEILTELKRSENQIVSNLSGYYKSYMYVYKNDYESALNEIELMNGNDIFSQLSKLLLAEVKDYIVNDINGAIDMYIYFLENYETSIYYEDIRLRLRKLIG